MRRRVDLTGTAIGRTHDANLAEGFVSDKVVTTTARCLSVTRKVYDHVLTGNYHCTLSACYYTLERSLPSTLLMRAQSPKPKARVPNHLPPLPSDIAATGTRTV